jgi:hypothetical protein
MAGLQATTFIWLPPGANFCKHKLPNGGFAYVLSDNKADAEDDLPTVGGSSPSAKRNRTRGVLFEITGYSETYKNVAAKNIMDTMSSTMTTHLKDSYKHLQTFNSGTFKGAMIDRDALDDSDQSLGLRNVKIVDWFLWGAKMRYMTERVKKEKEQNINHSRSTDPVAFGQVIQLRHLKTGKFVEAAHRQRGFSSQFSTSTAHSKRGFLELKLTKAGSQGSWLTFGGALKSQLTGNPVVINSQVRLQSFTFAQFQLRTSGSFLHLDAHRREVDLYKMVGKEGRWRLHRYEQTGGDGNDLLGMGGEDEQSVAAAEGLGGTRAGGQEKGTGTSGFVRVGSAVRLYHHEAEAFICASADKFEVDRAHRAYMQEVASSVGGLPQHQQQQNFSIKQLFVIERGDDREYAQSGGTVMYNGHYRFRHIASGKFLSVTTSSGDSASAGQDDDAQEDNVAGVLVTDKMLESTLFTIARIGEEAAVQATKAAAELDPSGRVTQAVAEAAAALALAEAAGPSEALRWDGTNRLRIMHNQTGRWLSTDLQTKAPRANKLDAAKER